jgi:hypothetical protein
MKINLIPEAKREQILIRKINLLVTNVAVVVGIILGGLIVIFTVYMGGKSLQIKNISEETTRLQGDLKTYEAFEKTVLNIQKSVADVKLLLNSEDRWNYIFDSFQKATPDDIRFKTLNISENLLVYAELEGKNINSIDRFIKSFQNFKRNNIQVFSGVDVSGYTVTENGGVNFSSNFTLNKEALTSSESTEQTEKL